MIAIRIRIHAFISDRVCLQIYNGCLVAVCLREQENDLKKKGGGGISVFFEHRIRYSPFYTNWEADDPVGAERK